MILAPSKFSPQKKAIGHAPRIVIVGGGFGGLYTALYLQKYHQLQNASITLIEPRQNFLFTPLLYEVLTDEMLLWEVAPSYDSLLAGTTIQWCQDWADYIDLGQQQVRLRQAEPLAYDYLVVATGAKTRPLSIPGLPDHALTFRSLDDVVGVKARLDHLARISSPVVVTVMGAGASGVELATKVADRLGPRATVRLVDRSEQILKLFPQGLRRQALRALKQRGVALHLKTTVDEVGANHICLNGEPHVNHLTLGATGTEPMPWSGTAVTTNERGQVSVRPTLQLQDYDNVFVIGDAAAQASPDTAQAAYQAAATVAKNLAKISGGRRPHRFRYIHLGDMLALGKGAGGVCSFGLNLGGRLGGLVRRMVYLHRMPTNHHRFKVARRALRLVLGQRSART